MKKILLLTLFLPLAALAQGESGKTLAATMDVFVFPAEGQDASQQSKDEVTCYEWAVGNTGSDPFDLAKQEQADQQQAQAEAQAAEQAGRGSAARGAVRGAAAGALIGEIANDDASEGAAWGAAAGAVRGRRMGRQAQQQAQAQAAASTSGTARGGDGRAARELQEGVQRLPGSQELHGQVLIRPEWENNNETSSDCIRRNSDCRAGTG